MSNLKMAFFGTPEFAVIILEILKGGGLTPAVVVTAPDSRAGRGLELREPPAKIWARQNQISVLQPEKLKDRAFLADLQKAAPDLFVVASYGKILPPELLALPIKNTINVHPSLLPKYRGPSPIEGAILDGEQETGVTIMLVDDLMDHGPILAQEKLPQDISGLKFSELEKMLAQLGGKMLLATIPHWINGKIKPKEQNHAEATYTKKITKEDGRLNWQEPADKLLLKIRALNPWPGTFFFWDKNGRAIRIIITDAEIVPDHKDKKSGQVYALDGKMVIQCGRNSILVKRIKAEGKKEASSIEFLRGHSSIVGSILP